MKKVSDMKVRSHVGRDLLASAAAFKSEASVVWEYVVNGLQYVERGQTPRVSVMVDQSSRSITIADNGIGMSAADLGHFFTMHGENRDRLAGRPGRGKFGTGKSAAFGIAKSLTVETIRDGHRNCARLTREMIDRSTGADIAVDWLVRNEPSSLPNGTIVSIEGVLLRQIRTAPIVEYVERHLQAFRASSPEVAVNTHVCTYREPEIESVFKFEPTDEQARVLGGIELHVKVARAPLPEAEQGIVVTAGPMNLVAVERAGLENKEFGAYIFGEVDVPNLENASTPLAPYDSSRSLQLNLEHPVALELVGFIGSKVEKVRMDLVRRAKEARKSEVARRLEQHAQQIADLLNSDFNSMRDRLINIRSVGSRPGNSGAQFGGGATSSDAVDDWVRGTQEPGRVDRPQRQVTQGDGVGRPAPDIPAAGAQDPAGGNPVDPSGGGDGPHRKPRGGFRVVYQALGRSEQRSRYDERSLSILINLDHPVLSAALTEDGVEELGFRRLSYEIAFSEYSMALGYELLKQDPGMPGDDLLYEVRSSLNRVASSAAALYK